MDHPNLFSVISIVLQHPIRCLSDCQVKEKGINRSIYREIIKKRGTIHEPSIPDLRDRNLVSGLKVHPGTVQGACFRYEKLRGPGGKRLEQCATGCAGRRGVHRSL